MISTPQFNINLINGTEFVITFKNAEKNPPRELLDMCQNIVKHDNNVHFQIVLRDNKYLEMSGFLHDNISTLHKYSFCTSDVYIDNLELIPCPKLTHLSFCHLKLAEFIVIALSVAASKGHLPSLIHLNLIDCKGLATHLDWFFNQPWPKLIYLNIRRTELTLADLQSYIFKVDSG